MYFLQLLQPLEFMKNKNKGATGECQDTMPVIRVGVGSEI